MAVVFILEWTSTALAFQSNDPFLMFRNKAVKWPCVTCMYAGNLNYFCFDADERYWWNSMIRGMLICICFIAKFSSTLWTDCSVGHFWLNLIDWCRLDDNVDLWWPWAVNVSECCTNLGHHVSHLSLDQFDLFLLFGLNCSYTPPSPHFLTAVVVGRRQHVVMTGISDNKHLRVC